jgi:hypothetical protein
MEWRRRMAGFGLGGLFSGVFPVESASYARAGDRGQASAGYARASGA